MFDSSLLEIVAGLPGLVIALVIHEYAHARVAVAMGDFTPRMMGRLTLNPMAHIDPIGLIALLLVRFGWAKPVVINPRNFKNVRRGELLVSLAGPGANLLVAFCAMFCIAAFQKAGIFLSVGGQVVLSMMVLYNINFAIFNLIPLPPLDGSKVLMTLLPGRWAYQMAALERYSFVILLIFLATPVLSYILVPLQQLILVLFHLVLGVIF